MKRGTEFIDPVPMNWGKTLTLIGAIRLHGWVVLRTMFATANAERFVAWLTTHLLPRLQAGDVVVLDNLRAHHDPRVASRCRARGVRLLYLPPRVRSNHSPLRGTLSTLMNSGSRLIRDGLTRLVCSTVPPERSMVRVFARSRGQMYLALLAGSSRLQCVSPSHPLRMPTTSQWFSVAR